MSIKSLSISTIVLVLAAAMFFLLPKSYAEYLTPARFDDLKKSGQPMLVAIHADWCSTCKTQERILQELLDQPEFKRIKLLYVDFDTQLDVVKSFGVQWQSTLIVFKNGREVGRSTADHDMESIADLLRMSL